MLAGESAAFCYFDNYFVSIIHLSFEFLNRNQCIFSLLHFDLFSCSKINTMSKYGVFSGPYLDTFYAVKGVSGSF